MKIYQPNYQPMHNWRIKLAIFFFFSYSIFCRHSSGPVISGVSGSIFPPSLPCFQSRVTFISSCPSPPKCCVLLLISQERMHFVLQLISWQHTSQIKYRVCYFFFSYLLYFFVLSFSKKFVSKKDILFHFCPWCKVFLENKNGTIFFKN